MKINIRFHPAYIALFLLLAFLCYQAHQFTRHLTGALLCGRFGSMTFTVATPRQPCAFPTLLTLSGPLLTYGLAYWGMFLLRSPKYARFAYTLIFASFAHLRFIQTLTGRGDELVLAQQWFGVTNRAIVALAVFLIGLPPILAAWRAIAVLAEQARRRWLIFAGSWLLPLPVLVALLFGDAFLFESSRIGMQLGSLFGIWTTVLATDMLAGALFLVFGPRHLLSERGR